MELKMSELNQVYKRNVIVIEDLQTKIVGMDFFNMIKESSDGNSCLINLKKLNILIFIFS